MVEINIYSLFLFIHLIAVKASYYGYEVIQKDLMNHKPNYDLESNNRYKQNYEKRVAREDQNWPQYDISKLGQVCGVAICPQQYVHIFQRDNVIWDQSSFDANNVYNVRKREPIKNDTIIVLDPSNGKIVKSWGSNMFYMPHGISFDPQGNIWLTDVALHQVFRYKRDQLTKPDLVLGEAFVPGDDDKHFCKPTDIAISSSGIIYISDGYCNSRILMFSPEGNFITKFGLRDNMLVPHSLTLLELEDLVCVADRENRRILCYTAGLNGKRQAGRLVFNVQHPRLGRVFAIDHIGDVILAANGADENESAPQGISLDLATEQLVDIWEPKYKFVMPHDIAVSSDQSSFYVCDLFLNAPKKLYKFNI